MRKPGKFEAAYQALGRLASARLDEDALEQLRGAIGGTKSLLAARAAEIAGRHGVSDLVPDMLAAFERFMIDGARVDKGCGAKNAIVEALNGLEHVGDSVFLTGARYVQMEPAFGEPVDTAVNLRCNCAFGLARIGHPDAHYVLAELLVDLEAAVRSAAAKALAYMATPEAEVMLRMKVLTGDQEPGVIGECFSGLMTMAPERSLEFVARYLGSEEPGLAQCAALSVAQSHLPEAFEVLRRRWEQDPLPAMRRMLVLPIALVRSDEAFSFLLTALRKADGVTASHILTALDLYTDDASVRRVREVLESRESRR